MSERTAIVLFNLGGPDGPAAVEPFLKNLFSDPAILRVPALLRAFLARTISRRRAPIAREIYQQMGGGSPILPNTQAQAQALTAALSDLGTVKTFIAMRYWHPRAKEAAERVAAFAPTRIVLLPLYPQFSTTTTASSLKEWQEVAGSIAAPVHAICCYPRETGFIDSLAALVAPKLAEAAQRGRPRLLLSAHGLPEKVVKSGDPYQWQVEESARALEEKLGEVDLVICYQSRVGPMKWIGPATVDEVKRAGADKVPLVVAPVAFVSEHSETLVELDIELRHVAEEAGVPFYARVPTVDCSPPFITGLARLVREALARGPGLSPDGGKRICGASWGGCPCKGE